jgi:hypothetical protein
LRDGHARHQSIATFIQCSCSLLFGEEAIETLMSGTPSAQAFAIKKRRVQTPASPAVLDGTVGAYAPPARINSNLKIPWQKSLQA